MERFLYRLSQSAQAQRFIFKGVLILRVGQGPQARPTMDIDILGKTTDNSPAAVIAQVREVSAWTVIIPAVEGVEYQL